MSDDIVLGIDCGASKVMTQSATFCSRSNKISPGIFHKEYLYSTHPDWNHHFKPVPLTTQKAEYSSKNISLTKHEVNQGNVIIETILKAIEDAKGNRFGLCFPGLKDQNSIVVMANGPRILNLKNRINQIKPILNDSDCCVMGEWKSTIGKMQGINNGIYIGGGTGIADGIILNGEMLKLNDEKEILRSWEINVDSQNTVESQLSPAGMINNYNNKYNTRIKTLSSLSKQETFNEVLKKALEAFSLLVNKRIHYFCRRGSKLKRVVIGQRLGQFLNESDLEHKEMFKNSISVPLKISSDRRTAALGAAMTVIC